MSNSNEDLTLSSPSDSDTQTPLQNSTSNIQILTPDSQSQPLRQTSNMPISPTGLAGANSNGKRPINTISNGADDVEDLASSGKPRQQDFPPKVHERSGYVWEREEDAPGYIWLNKKAQDEYHRAAEALVHREFMVGSE